MTNYSYSPLPDFSTLTPWEGEICQYLRKKGTVGFTEFPPDKFNKGTLNKHLKELVEKGIVIKTQSGKYQKYELRKEVRIEYSDDPFKTIIADGKIQNSRIKWFDLKDIPLDIRESLLGNSWYGFFFTLS